MTHCFGWIYGKSAFLVADSAVTGSAKPVVSHSSFGQLHDRLPNGYVSEGALKIVPLSNGVAAAFAGNIPKAIMLLQFLIEHFNKKEEIEKQINRMALSLGPFNDPKEHVEIILISSTKKNAPKLFTWNTENERLVEHAKYCKIGSLNSYLADIAPQIVDALPLLKISKEMVLPIISAVVQSYGAYAVVANEYVGGLVYGYEVNSGAGAWQKDTNYILTNSKFSEHILVSACVRQNVLVVHSSYDNSMRAIVNKASQSNVKKWCKTWKHLMSRDIVNMDYKFFSVITTDRKCIALISNTMGENKGKYISIRRLRDRKYEFSIHRELVEKIKIELEAPTHDEFSMHIIPLLNQTGKGRKNAG